MNAETMPTTRTFGVTNVGGDSMSERIILGLVESEWRRVASEDSPMNNAFRANLFDRKALALIGDRASESEIRDYQQAAQIFREAAA